MYYPPAMYCYTLLFLSDLPYNPYVKILASLSKFSHSAKTLKAMNSMKNKFFEKRKRGIHLEYKNKHVPCARILITQCQKYFIVIKFLCRDSNYFDGLRQNAP